MTSDVIAFEYIPYLRNLVLMSLDNPIACYINAATWHLLQALEFFKEIVQYTWNNSSSQNLR
jgi:hypothetical protein